MFLYFCLWLFKSLSQMAFYFSNLILQTAIYNQNAQVVNNIDEKKSGSYTLEIKNTTSGPTAIAITNSNNMDILQKPIINTKNKYLNFNVID